MRQQTKKILLLLIGWFFVALGTIGLFRVFGPPLQDWSRYGVIPLRAKIVAIGTMAISATLVIIFSSTPWYGITAMLLLMGIGAGFILTRPSRPKNQDAA